ncbi:hypothetical protein WICPIJ_007043 [Wickerhamomyces pijperi]|uniref:GATA-type domain-containing protein n=1 Tax=Wickerhamomyces pijperi TaxID=599730 RepID=A0A9P8Q2M3_WICPI|nr:hypothetical protein WICPIJ_007043 [Wickerhamomyces pijperi]
MPESKSTCSNCQVTKTPMWRRTLDSDTDKIITLCNACGLYYKSKGSHRPNVLISKKSLLTTTQLLDKITKDLPHDTLRVIPNQQDIKLTDLKIITCSNCSNMNTSIWRKDENGKNICNACGLYYKKKGVHRVVKSHTKKNDVYFEIDQGNLLRFNVIKRRKRSVSASTSASAPGSEDLTRSHSVAQPPASAPLSSISTPTTYTSDVSSNINPRESTTSFRRSSMDLTPYQYQPTFTQEYNIKTMSYPNINVNSSSSALSYLSMIADSSMGSLDSTLESSPVPSALNDLQIRGHNSNNQTSRSSDTRTVSATNMVNQLENDLTVSAGGDDKKAVSLPSISSLLNI